MALDLKLEKRARLELNMPYIKFKQTYNTLNDADLEGRLANVVIKCSKKDNELNKTIFYYVPCSKASSLKEILDKCEAWYEEVRERNLDFCNKIRAQRLELQKGAQEGINKTNIQNIEKENKILVKELKDNSKNTAVENAEQVFSTNNIPILSDKFENTSWSTILASPDVVKNISVGSGSTFLFLGSSKSGKTTSMIQAALTFKRLYKKTIIILCSGTYKSDGGMWSSLKTELGDDFIPVEDLSKSVDLAETIQKETNGVKPILFLIDDIVDQKNNKSALKLFTTLRNLNISTMMALQHCMMFNKNSRGSVNYIIAGRLNNSESINDCWDKFMRGLYSDKKNYLNDYINDTLNYKKLVIDMLNDKIYSMK